MNEYTPAIVIREMCESDIASAEELRESAGWNQTPTDWRRLLRYEPRGCFVACIDDIVVGTVTTTSYGSKLAWIGMMLVRPEYRRRGIATSLMNTALGYLRRKNITCIKLDATPDGEFVYRRLGFQPEWQFHRWKKDGHDNNVSQPSAGDLWTPFSPDVSAFGVDRSNWLHAVAADSSIIINHDCGFGMLRQGAFSSYIGPVTATDTATACSIISELVASTKRDVIWDIPGPNTAAAELSRSLGFRPVRDLLRMWTGASLLQPNLDFQFALCGPGTG